MSGQRIPLGSPGTRKGEGGGRRAKVHDFEKAHARKAPPRGEQRPRGRLARTGRVFELRDEESCSRPRERGGEGPTTADRGARERGARAGGTRQTSTMVRPSNLVLRRARNSSMVRERANTTRFLMPLPPARATLTRMFSGAAAILGPENWRSSGDETTEARPAEKEAWGRREEGMG